MLLFVLMFVLGFLYFTVSRLYRMGLMNSKLTAAHMTQLTDEEIALVAESGTSVVHCPSSNMKLASGFCPVAKLLAAGVNVASKLSSGLFAPFASVQWWISSSYTVC